MRGIAYADGAVASEILLALAENNLEARVECYGSGFRVGAYGLRLEPRPV